jgi:hypothetical protein
MLPNSLANDCTIPVRLAFLSYQGLQTMRPYVSGKLLLHFDLWHVIILDVSTIYAVEMSNEIGR